jgi:phosphate transport system protein
MPRHLEREIERLKRLVFRLSTMVEENVSRAVRCVEKRDEAAAREIILLDNKVDQMELDVEEECLKLLALYQPVAIDLRFIVAILKMNNDLERIGDLAVNMAEAAVFLSRREPVKIPFDFSDMASKVRRMLKGSLDALVNLDAELANKVCAADDEVDDINERMYSKVENAIRNDPFATDAFICYLTISRHLERIADQATNIAEDVIYMVEGRIHRHGTDRISNFEAED